MEGAALVAVSTVDWCVALNHDTWYMVGLSGGVWAWGWRVLIRDGGFPFCVDKKVCLSAGRGRAYMRINAVFCMKCFWLLVIIYKHVWRELWLVAVSTVDWCHTKSWYMDSAEWQSPSPHKNGALICRELNSFSQCSSFLYIFHNKAAFNILSSTTGQYPIYLSHVRLKN